MKREKLLINSSAVRVSGKVWFITKRGNFPGELRFSSIDKIRVGDEAEFYRAGELIFKGKIFRVTQREKSYECVAYDLLRYFTNKDTFVYESKTAAELLRIICSSYGIPTGKIANTKMRISSQLDDGRSLFSIMDNALTLTASAGYGEYVLYDGGGIVELLSADELDSGIVISPDICREFTVTEDIDENTFTAVKLAELTEGGRKYHVYEDEIVVKKYGKLQYYGTLSPIENGTIVGRNILSAYSSPIITVDCLTAFCVDKIRGGSAVTVIIDGKAKRMICERAEHIYDPAMASSKLTLSSI